MTHHEVKVASITISAPSHGVLTHGQVGGAIRLLIYTAAINIT
jgi:hypothetical protein